MATLKQARLAFPVIKSLPHQSDLSFSYGFCRELVAAERLDDILALALNRCMRFLDAEVGSIFLYQNPSDSVVLYASKGENPYSTQGVTLRLGEGISGQVARDRKGVVVRDAKKEGIYNGQGPRTHYKTVSFVSAPISLNGQLVGVINLTDRGSGKPFSQEDLDFLTLISPHVAGAVVRASEVSKGRKTGSGSVVGKLTAGLSHEINNPLGGVLRYINLSLEHVDEDSLAREFLVQAKSGVRRIMGVMRSLLEFARRTQYAAQTSSPVQTIVEQGLSALREQAGEKGVWIEMDVEPHLPPVVDCGLQQVVSNLIDNALDAVSTGGRIKIEARRVRSDVRMVVEDNGEGIDESIREKIFDPFFSTKPLGQGTGLGLSISKEIVEQGGGTISVESHKGIGTRFIMRLRIAPEGTPSAQVET